jgi:hypothetical protein
MDPVEKLASDIMTHFTYKLWDRCKPILLDTFKLEVFGPPLICDQCGMLYGSLRSYMEYEAERLTTSPKPPGHPPHASADAPHDSGSPAG